MDEHHSENEASGCNLLSYEVQLGARGTRISGWDSGEETRIKEAAPHVDRVIMGYHNIP